MDECAANAAHRDAIAALYERGAWLVPLGEDGLPLVGRFTKARPALDDAAAAYGLIPWSLRLLVVDIDSGDPATLTRGWPLDAYVQLPSKSEGRWHLYVAWAEEWGLVGNARFVRGECTGDLRHRNGFVRLYDPVALAAALTRPLPATGRIRQNIRTLQRPLPPGRAKSTLATGGSVGEWGKGGRNDLLFKSMMDDPEREADWRAAALASGLEAREVEATIRSALRTVQERAEAKAQVLASPEWGLDHQNPASWARQCPLPIRWNETYRRWYIWRDRYGWHTPEEGEVAIQNALSDWAWDVAHSLDEGDGAKTILRGFDKQVAEVTKALQRRDATRITPKSMDIDPDLVALPDATLLNLADGRSYEYAPDQPFYRPIGTTVAYEFAPTWADFLEYAIPDADTREWLRAWFAYALSGWTNAETALCLRGISGTGKSTISRVLERLAGDVASVQRGEHMVGSGESSAWVVDLVESRCAIVNEVPAGKWSSTLKGVISGDPQAARRLYAQYARYQPKCTVTITTNALPALGKDDGMDRRLALIEMFRRPPERDARLFERLDAELPAILNWCTGDWHERHFADVVHGRTGAMTAAIEVYVAQHHPLRRHLTRLLDDGDGAVTYRQLRDALSMDSRITERERETYQNLTDGTLNAALKALGRDPELDASGEWLVRGAKLADVPTAPF